MKPKITRGKKVYDTWWPNVIGTVTRVTKTTITVDYTTYTWKYDKCHFQFLRLYEEALGQDHL